MWKVVFLLGFCLLCAYATAGLLGDYEDANIDDEDVVTAAGHATRLLSMDFGGKYHYRLVKIIKAKKQVVAGMRYKINLVIGETNCKIMEVEYENIDKCEFQSGITTYRKCNVIVYKDVKDNHRLIVGGCVMTPKKDI